MQTLPSTTIHPDTPLGTQGIPSESRRDPESRPFGSHGRAATLGDLDDDIGHSVFVSWVGVAATLVGVGIVGLLVKPRTKMVEMVSDLFLITALLILCWAMFVFFYFRRRHWTAWILFFILLFAIASIITCACM